MIIMFMYTVLIVIIMITVKYTSNTSISQTTLIKSLMSTNKFTGLSSNNLSKHTVAFVLTHARRNQQEKGYLFKKLYQSYYCFAFFSAIDF